MTLPAWLIAAVRTAVASLVSAALSAAWIIEAVGWVRDSTGIELTQVQVEGAAFGMTIFAVTALFNWLGKQPAFQWFNRIISLGMAKSPAVYDKAGTTGPPDTAVDMAGEAGQFGDDDGDANLGTVVTILAIVVLVLLVLRLT